MLRRYENAAILSETLVGLLDQRFQDRQLHLINFKSPHHWELNHFLPGSHAPHLHRVPFQLLEFTFELEVQSGCYFKHTLCIEEHLSQCLLKDVYRIHSPLVAPHTDPIDLKAAVKQLG